MHTITNRITHTSRRLHATGDTIAQSINDFRLKDVLKAPRKSLRLKRDAAEFERKCTAWAQRAKVRYCTRLMLSYLKLE